MNATRALAMRRTFFIVIAFVVAAFLLPDPAQAQADFSTRSSYTLVRCESYGARQNFCAADTRGGIRLANDVSGRCQLGRSWGYNGRGIWVAGGCRADFALGRGDRYGYGWGYSDRQFVVCASDDFQRRFCPADTARGVRLVNQISNSECIRGRSWWRDERGIVVDNGCAGEFELGYRDAAYASPPATGGGGSYRPDRFVCTSISARRYCPADVGVGAVALVTQRGRAPCEYGRTWSYDSRGVWVSNGCSAEFEVGYPEAAWTPEPALRYLRCESVDYRRTVCAADGARRVSLQRRLSRADCVEGRSWGTERGRVWVDQGCAADFVLH